MSQQINLFNPVFLKQRKYFSALTMVQALGIIFAGALAMSVFSGFQLSRIGREVDASNAQVAAAQKQLDMFKTQSGGRQKNKALEEEVQKAELEVKSLHLAVETLQKGGIGDTKGYSEYLRAFSRQIVSGIWLTGFGISGAEVSLQGRALQPELVPAYIKRLKSESIMQGKSFSALQIQMPQSDPETASKEGAGVTKASQGKYVEFNLQSSGQFAETGLVESRGMKTK